MAFYFVRWLPAGQLPRASRTFASKYAARQWARRAKSPHPYQIVKHSDGEQTIVEEAR